MLSRGVFNHVRNVITTTSEGYLITFGTYYNHLGTYCNTFRRG